MAHKATGLGRFVIAGAPICGYKKVSNPRVGNFSFIKKSERATRLELVISAWEARVLPRRCNSISTTCKGVEILVR